MGYKEEREKGGRKERQNKKEIQVVEGQNRKSPTDGVQYTPKTPFLG